MNIADVALSRYSTKEFNPEKKISAELFEQIKTLLRFSPSSVNSQPWHFIIAESDDAKARIAKATQGPYAANEAKVKNASHVIVFCAKTDIDDTYTEHLLTLEDQDGRFPDPNFKGAVHKGRSYYVNMHRSELEDAHHWMQKQVYLNMGSILLGAGSLGVDAVPIEGVDTKVLNQEFALAEKGYTAVAMIALGYRSDTDFNASLPKSRRPEDEIFTILS
ncbi:oxygen-insensitive NAD(P)H nitroreductase [Vibrio sp. JC009]|uniref:oxygen-insensitive NAD(P)H nitroreductase n=1 Tax=Vibrio sp. JC009 TaxID=2912314 RepID=UPI0023AF5BE2|nr:oxygen-insensitive NAD(P)H nitroreductase [Vibrio sp. JC009]WED24487.1 oxygen-insensitive NAD(P)H nitroreductase [Vibrio sp. JC009]